MKILYVGNDSHGVELMAFALQRIAPGVAVAWIPSLKAARGWIEQNQDVAVLTVEVNPDPAASELFIRQIRDLGVAAPLVLVAGGSSQPAPPILAALADATLPKDASLLQDLPTTIGGLLKDRPSEAPPEPSLAPAVRSAAQPLPSTAPAESPRSNPFAHLVPAPDALEQELRQARTMLAQAHQDREALGAINVELERRVADATAAFERAESRHAAEMRDAAARLGDERAHANERSSHASAALDALRAELVEQAAALHKAEQQAAVDRRAAAEDTARRQARAESDLLRETSTRQAAERAAAAGAAAEARHASELAAVAARLADQEQRAEQRMAEAAARLDEHQRQANERSAQAAAALDALQARLVEATDALQRAGQQAESDRQAAAKAAATRQAAFDADLKESARRQEALANQLAASEQQAAAALDALRVQLVEQAAVLHKAEQQAAVDRHAAAEDARRAAKAESDLVRETSTRQAVERAEHASELSAAAARLADQKQQFEQRVVEAAAHLDEQQRQAAERSAQAAAALDALQTRLGEATDALQRAGQQAESDRQAAAGAAATRQATFDAELKQLEAKHDVLTTKLADADVRLRQAEERHQTGSAAATARLAASEQQAAAALDALRTQLMEQAAALHKAEQQAAVDRHAAAEELARRQAAAESDLARESSTRQAAERAVAASEAAHAAAKERHASELAAVAARLADQQQQADLDLQASTRAATTRQAAFDAELKESASRLETLRLELVAVTAEASIARQAAIEASATHQAVVERQTTELARSAARLEEAQRQADAQLAQAAANAREHEARLEARLREESAKRETLENELVQARAAAEQAQRRFVDASNEMRERAREHAVHLEERTARERAEWEGTLAERQERVGQLQRDGDLVRQSLASKEGDLKRLQAAHEEQRGRFDRARAASDADLSRAREECTALQETLEDHRRQFDTSPVNLCRCAADGTVTQATRALARLLGYGSAEPLVSGGVAVFDSSDDLRWLIDRCLSSRSAQSIETTWKKKDGSRIVVRLVAAATSAGCVDLAAEDITNVRELEEKLRHAQRLEAVARYASEVAGTCETLLRDVEHAGPQWLSLIENDSTRQQGERLLADVIRVSAFLRQLAEYGGKQKQALPLVEVNSVLRDLASVLKRVAGDDIELVLPKGWKPLNLDVETEHVERIFVNIAAYARARMPHGGRLLIDVATVLVDRQFTEKYPSVRPGAHVLFTVTEVKGPALSPAAGILGSNGPDGHDTPGVDLGMLQSLVVNCGGHLWIAAEPSGDMILKIHLPRRALDERAATTGPARWISRLAAATRH